MRGESHLEFIFKRDQSRAMGVRAKKRRARKKKEIREKKK